MEFFIKANKDNMSMLINSFKDRINRTGIDFDCRSNVEELADIEPYLNGLIIGKSLGHSSTFFCDIVVKPDLLLGISTPIKEMIIQIGVFPPSYLYIIAISGEIKKGIDDENFVEKLGFVENLMVKLLDESGLAQILQSKCCFRWIRWDLSSVSPKIRNSSHLRSKIHNLQTNKLFPLEKKEEMEKTFFKNEDVFLNLSPTCLVDIFERRSSSLIWRFLTIHSKDAETENAFGRFEVEFDEPFVLGLATWEASADVITLEEEIGKIELSLNEIMKQLSTNEKTSRIFARIEELEPKLWNYTNDNALFSQRIDYIKDIVENRDLVSEINTLSGKLKNTKDLSLPLEVRFSLTKELQSLDSKAGLLVKRGAHLSEEFNSLKDSLATRIQMELEKRNLSIQTALGFLQVTAVMVLLWGIVTYFYPFTNDSNHITAYTLTLVLPLIAGYVLYRRLRSEEKSDS